MIGVGKVLWVYSVGQAPYGAWGKSLHLLGPHLPCSVYDSTPNLLPLHILFPGGVNTVVLEGKNKKEKLRNAKP